MKKNYTLILIALIFVITISKAQTIPNASFETWTNFGTYSDPASWSSFNSFTSGSGIFTCEQGTPGIVGASYLKLTSKLIGASVSPGIAVSRSTYLPYDAAGFAYSLRSANFTGQYQYTPGTGDNGAILVMLSKWNTTLMKRDTITFDFLLLTTATTGWTTFNIPLTYASGSIGNEFPDSATIFLESSATPSPVAGSMFYADDLAFSGSVPAGINEIEQSTFSLAPNPFNFQTTISFIEEQRNTSVIITDISGREIKTINFTGRQLVIDRAEMKAGIYFVRTSDEKKNVTNKKILIQ